ncbi:MAG: octaprenyl diphosphate synthase [Chromatiales bacterium 21-64-14]|nr:MAG: octaprenyl diphosphate synthase [Chromatiales bacterium 21-64-14]HQU16852.1 polyprenyl synthetase family protein [Gammaproteobacteria bacterium]
MSLEATRLLVEEDMRSVDALIRRRLHSNIVLINQLAHYIINSGGKRLRPVLLLLCARACGYRGTCHIDLAAVVEFIHTATLLHDDVVDDSALRRGRETANAIWGNEASVLVGDFLYSRAFEMMVDVKSPRVMEIMAHATNTIAEGEVMQLLNCRDPETTEDQYLEVIRCKTAQLFEASAQLGAVLGEMPAAQEHALAGFGRHLGNAFQLVDDVLDYSGSAGEIGKNIGDDLAEGKPTLPLIYALRQGTPQQAAVLQRAIREGGREYIDAVQEAVESTGAIAYTEALARREAAKARALLAAIPASRYRDGLDTLADFSVYRTY